MATLAALFGKAVCTMRHGRITDTFAYAKKEPAIERRGVAHGRLPHEPTTVEALPTGLLIQHRPGQADQVEGAHQDAAIEPCDMDQVALVEALPSALPCSTHAARSRTRAKERSTVSPPGASSRAQ